MKTVFELNGLDLADQSGEDDDAMPTFERGGTLLDLLAFAVGSKLPVIDVLVNFQQRNGAAPYRESSIVRRLRAGESLGSILSGIRLHPPLSEPMRAAIAEAEKRNRLDRMLPMVANFERRRRLAKNRLAQRLAFPIFYFGCLLLLACLVSLLFDFSLRNVFREITPPERFPEVAAGLARNRTMLGWLALLGGATLLPLLVDLWLNSSLMLRMPLFGRLIRMRALYELSESFHCFLTGGCDVVDAARWAREAEPRRWLQKRLDRMIARLEAGENWLDAWRELGFNEPLAGWMLANGAAQDRLPEAFADLRRLMDRGSRRGFLQLARMLEIGFLLVAAAWVGAVAVLVFRILIVAIKAV